MLLARLKALAVVLLAVALLGGGALLTGRASRTEPKDATPEGKAQAAAPKDEKAPMDKEALQGTWVVASGEKNGVKLPDEKLKGWGELTFADDKVTREGGERRVGTFKLDPDKKPKEIDLFTEENTWKGVYELKKTTLKLALKFGEERPTELDSTGGLLLVFEKKK
jgi:uncharacterized protein (TIGR03067 family)